MNSSICIQLRLETLLALNCPNSMSCWQTTSFLLMTFRFSTNCLFNMLFWMKHIALKTKTQKRQWPSVSFHALEKLCWLELQYKTTPNSFGLCWISSSRKNLRVKKDFCKSMENLVLKSKWRTLKRCLSLIYLEESKKMYRVLFLNFLRQSLMFKCQRFKKPITKESWRKTSQQCSKVLVLQISTQFQFNYENAVTIPTWFQLKLSPKLNLGQSQCKNKPTVS